MKDFADISNSVGTFPDVAAQDCSGPGETDGTAIIADTMSDYMGFIQAILDEVGDTPNDSADVHDASQILDDLKLLPAIYTLAMGLGCPYQSDWEFRSSRWRSLVNVGSLYLPLKLVPGVEIDLDISLRIDPGAVRTGANRMAGGIVYNAWGSGAISLIGSYVYDDGTASAQTMNLSTSSLTPSEDNCYYIELLAGNTGAASPDDLLGAKVIITKA